MKVGQRWLLEAKRSAPVLHGAESMTPVGMNSERKIHVGD